MMHRVQCALLAAVAAIGLASVASADDMPANARPVIAPVANWTGCYIGANAGYGWTKKGWVDAGVPEGSNTSAGGLVGGQTGCDYQFASNWVVGIQGMYDWANLNGSHPYTDDTRYIDRSKVSSIATLIGRIGYTVEPATLLYLKGGAAWVGDTFTEECSPAVDVCPGVAKVTRTGWTIGGGLEHQFAQDWSVFIEYNYMDFGRRTETLVYTDASTYDYGIKQNVQTLQLGISYRFSTF